MAANNGKAKEMDAVIVVANMAKKHPAVDLLRYTTTNTADNGMDIEMVTTQKHINELLQIAEGKRTDFSNPNDDTSQKIGVRIDAKHRTGKITKSEMEKFIDDISKHPRKEGHLLYGSELTKGASDVLLNAQRTYDGEKIIAHISEKGVKNIENAVLPKLKDEDN